MTAMNHLAAALLPVLLASSLKASVVFFLAWGAARALKDAHPSVRHLLWLFAVSSYPLIFALSFAGPLAHTAGVAIPIQSDGAAGPVSTLLMPAAGALGRGGQPGVVPAGVSRGFPWYAAALLLWAAGAFVCLLPVLTGRLRARLLIGRADQRVPARQQAVLKRCAADLGISRAVEARRSFRCTMPFTYGLLRPVIHLPASGMPAENLAAVLLHELWHVKRLDALTQTFGWAVRSLFWFVPFVWVAYSRQLLEQEKACDAGVLQDGVEKRQYAAFILDAARRAVDPLPVAGAFLAGRRRKVLKDRIQSILQGGKFMKKGKWLFVLAVTVMAAVVLLSGMSSRETITNEQAWQKLTGEWVNPDLAGDPNFPQKMVLRPDLTGEDWFKISDKSAGATWTVKMRKNWTDAKGYLYCQFSVEYTPLASGRGVALYRLDPTGKVLEYTSWATGNRDKYPEAIDPQADTLHAKFYAKYFRN